jgi:hypothetical protein
MYLSRSTGACEMGSGSATLNDVSWLGPRHWRPDSGDLTRFLAVGRSVEDKGGEQPR